MGRRKPEYTIAFIDADGDLDVATFGDDVDGARERLAEFDDGKAKLFLTAPVPFSIRREPTVIIGAPAAPATRKKPGRKKKAAAPTSTNGTSGTRFDADTLEPAPAPAQQHPDVEA